MKVPNFPQLSEGCFLIGPSLKSWSVAVQASQACSRNEVSAFTLLFNCGKLADAISSVAEREMLCRALRKRGGFLCTV